MFSGDIERDQWGSSARTGLNQTEQLIYVSQTLSCFSITKLPHLHMYEHKQSWIIKTPFRKNNVIHPFPILTNTHVIFCKIQKIKICCYFVNALVLYSTILRNKSKIWWLTHIMPLVSFYTRGFLMFSGGIERERGMKWVKTKIFVFEKLFSLFPFPAGNYMFKVNNRNIRTRCEICSK